MGSSILVATVDAALQQQIRSGAVRVGGVADTRVMQGLARYLELLLLWNRRVNLTAISEPTAIVEKHFVDSLAVYPHIPANARSIIDVGSGAGFPGAVLALARPDITVTLVESIHKKTAFLETLRRELPLPNLSVLAKRIEDVELRVDVAVSRATWDLPDWLSRGMDLVHRPGRVIGMEGAELHSIPLGAVRHPYPLMDCTRAIIVLDV